MWYCFLQVVSTDNVQISGFVTSQECCDQYEEHGVGARGGGCALGQVVNFSNIGSPPVCTIKNFTQGAIFCNLMHVWVECIAMECSVVAVVGSM